MTITLGDVITIVLVIANAAATLRVLRQRDAAIDEECRIVGYWRPPPAPLPEVAHKGPHDTDADMFSRAADNLERGYHLGGGNLTDAVVRLIRREVKRAALNAPKEDR